MDSVRHRILTVLLLPFIFGAAYAEFPFLLNRMSLGLSDWTLVITQAIVMFVVALVIARRTRRLVEFIPIGISVGVGINAGVWADAFYDLFFNPKWTSGRMPPVEGIMFVVLAMPAGFLGIALGLFLGRKSRHNPAA